MSRGKKFLLIIGIWFLASSVISLFFWSVSPYREKKLQETVPVRNEVEREVKVKALKNEIVYMGRMQVSGLFFFMNAQMPSVGMGAPVVPTKSIEQFLYLVPPDERIYTAVGQTRQSDASIDQFVVKKAYWAFIENRAGIIIWEDVYSYYSYETKSWWRVTGFNEEEVIFSKTVFENEWVLLIPGSLLLVWMLAIFISAMNIFD